MTIHAFLRKEYEIILSPSGSYDENTGLWVVSDPASPAKKIIKASIQPASGKDIKFLPEATRSVDTIAVYTDENLSPCEDGFKGDMINVNNKLFKIVKKSQWNNNLLNHTYYLAQREGGSYG